MTDQQWKHLQDELKSISQHPNDGPADPAQFKQRVLQEYNRRNRQTNRGQWISRTFTGLAVGAAVWAAFAFTSGPLQMNNEIASPTKSAESPSNAKQQPQTMAPEQLLTQFFDLTISGKEQEARSMLASSLQNTKWLTLPSGNKTHLTGYAIKEISTGGESLRYQVSIGVGTYSNQSYIQNYEVTLAKQNIRWLITGIEPQNVINASEQAGTVVLDTGEEKKQLLIGEGEIEEQGAWTMFAQNPANPRQLALVVESNPSVLYKADSTNGRQLTKLTTLPPGEVGEIFWIGRDVLVMNFTPQDQASAHQQLFFDANSGEPLNQSWLTKHLDQLGLQDVHVIHSLPNNKVRIRSGAITMIADLNGHVLSTDQASEPQMQTVKYDQQGVKGLADQELSLGYPDQNANWPDQLNIPQENRLDLTREAGMYVSNGSVESFSIVNNELQIELRHQPGRVQILAVPYSMITLQSGQEIRIKAFDENGKVIGVPRTITLP